MSKWVIVVGVVIVVAIVVAGCMALNPQQAEQMRAVNARVEHAEAAIVELAAIAKDIQAKAAAGTMTPAASAQAMADVAAKVDATVKDYNAARADAQALADSGVPWWQIGLGILSTVLSGTTVQALVSRSKYRNAAAAVITGVEAVRSAVNTNTANNRPDAAEIASIVKAKAREYGVPMVVEALYQEHVKGNGR